MRRGDPETRAAARPVLAPPVTAHVQRTSADIHSTDRCRPISVLYTDTAMSERTQKIIRNIPPALKDALMDEAERRESNMNDVAVSILADAWGVPFTPTGKLTPGWTDATTVGLVMPRRLRRKLNVEAARRDTNATALVLDTLMDHFKLGTIAA